MKSDSDRLASAYPPCPDDPPPEPERETAACVERELRAFICARWRHYNNEVERHVQELGKLLEE